MLESSRTIISEYGLAAFLWILALTVIAWIGRVSLKNPLDVVSSALQDVELARQALREEIDHRDETIKKLREKVGKLSQELDELKEDLS